MTEQNLQSQSGAVPSEFVRRILESPEWRRAEVWGQPRRGHPEGTVGRHVFEQVIPFIYTWDGSLPEYDNLIALALLHDIGKPITEYRNGRLIGPSHSILSADVAQRLGAGERLVQVILKNDRAFSHWRKLLDKTGIWQADRWTAERRERFTLEFGAANLDLRLLVLFHRADNGYRRAEKAEDSMDPVHWFEGRLTELGLVAELPPEGRDQRLTWPGGA